MTFSESGQQQVYIGLGSNLADPVVQIKAARKAIGAMQQVTERSFSSLYRSMPMGPQAQPDYINAVMCVTTRLSAMALLRCLQAIENAQGRVRKQRWGARTLDLDILLYGEQQIDLPELQIPHYGIAGRAFVLFPLHEIAPDLNVPGQGRVQTLLAKCSPAEIEKIN